MYKFITQLEKLFQNFIIKIEKKKQEIENFFFRHSLFGKCREKEKKNFMKNTCGLMYSLLKYEMPERTALGRYDDVGFVYENEEAVQNI